MNTLELDRSIGEYSRAFRTFVNANHLPREWFAEPDHFAIKCADGQDYAETVMAIVETYPVLGVWENGQIDKRRLGSALLDGRKRVGGYDYRWIEIMEPRPGKEMPKGFCEHTEFTFPDHEAILRGLGARGLGDVEIQGNSGHTWVNVVIDDKGREIKFNDKPMVDVVAEERERGEITVVIPEREPSTPTVIDFLRTHYGN